MSALPAHALPAHDAPGDQQPSFADLGLPPRLIAALASRGITAPFAIQAAAIPDALAGRHILGRAATGSGKTLAFGLPMLARLDGRKAQPRRPLGLVLVPTRELAMQVKDGLEPLAHSLRLDLRLVIGGAPFGKQVDGLRRGADILVATPGRLEDLVRQGFADLSDVEVAILDEADHMTDLGFLPVVSALLEQVRPNGQRMLFSATLDRNVETLVSRFLRDPATHSTAPATASITTMSHHVLVVHPADKHQVAASIGAREGRTVMFVRTQLGAERLANSLLESGVVAGALHGGMHQGERNRTIGDFRDGRVPVLVATDVAARGIHVDDVSLVVHVDPAADPKDYLHRSGRTARAGGTGTVVTLAMPRQQREVASLTQRAGVAAAAVRVRPGDHGLAEITGARQPSGVPVTRPPAPARGRHEHRGHGRPGSARGSGRPQARGVTRRTAP